MDVPNLRKEDAPPADNKTKATPMSLEPGAQDSVSDGENVVKEYRTTGSGFSKDGAGGLNRGL